MSDKILHDNKWIQLLETDDGYVYSHEKRCGGEIISVLPFKRVEGEDGDEFHYLARMEATPCHEGDEIKFTSITGGVEECGIKASVIMELKEEAGVIATEDELIDLGFVYPSKSQDTKVYLFAVDITGKEVGEAVGDGSKHEASAYVEWSSDEEALLNCTDPFNIAITARLAMKLMKEGDNG